MEREVGCQGRELELGEGRSSETRLGLTPPEHQSQLFPTDLREVQADGKGSPPPACMVWCGVTWPQARMCMVCARPASSHTGEAI